MKKVLITAYNLDFGGIEKSLLTLLKNFDYSKYEVTLILEKKEGVFLKDIPSCVKIKEYRVSNSKNVFFRKMINMFKRFKWLILNYKKYDSSICYATYSMPGSFLALSSSNNSVLFVHSNYKYIYDKKGVYDFFDKRNISKYNKVVFVSNESKDDFIKFYPSLKEKCNVINNLVDYDDIMKKSKEKIEYKKSNNITILFVGRLVEKSKRITSILSLAGKFKNIKFLIIGDGPDKKMYEDIILKENLKNVEMLGAKKNPYPYFLISDYIILTSKYEGFPVVYNEAIVLSRPIITTINVTDDFISIPNRFGYIINDITEVEKILKNKPINMEKVDFNKLNKKRIEMIEKLLEGNDA